MARHSFALLRIIAWILGVLAALVIVIGLFLWLDPDPALAWLIQHPISAAIGRRIVIGGMADLEWGSPTRIVVTDLHIANPSWGSEPDMLDAGRMEIDLFPWTVIWGPTRIALVRFDRAKLLLEKSSSGEGNWQSGATAPAPSHRQHFPYLEHFVAEHSNFTWHNGATNAKTAVTITGLDMTAPKPEGDVGIKAAGELAGRFQALPVAFTSTMGPLAALRDTSRPYPVRLDGTLGHVAIHVHGTIGEPLDFSGLDLRLSMEGQRLDALASFMGVPMPVLPKFRGTSILHGGGGDWKLDALTIALGGSDLEGGIAVHTGTKVPQIRADLTSSRLDLADFKGVIGKTPKNAGTPPPKEETATDRIFSSTPIEIKKLPGIDAVLHYYGTHVISSTGVPFDGLRLGLTIQNGVLTVDPLQFDTSRGDFALKLSYTPFTRDTPPRLSANVDVHHIDLHDLLRNNTSPMLRQTAGILGGSAEIDTTGASMRDFMAHLNGNFGLFLQHGQMSDLLQQLAPLDVLEAIGVFATGDRPLPLDCVITRFDIRNGVATATTLLLSAADTYVTGAGNVNLADETIDMNLRPLNKHFRIVSLHTPVDIRGTLAHPQFQLQYGNVIGRVAAAVGVGVLFPPAALLPLVDASLGPQNACSKAIQTQPNPPTGRER